MRDPTRGFWRTARDFSPFFGAAVLAWGAVLVGSSISWWQYGLSLALALLAAVGTMLMLMGRRRPGVVPSALLFLLAVGLLRNSAGGISTGASALALLPVFVTALYSRSRRDLFLVLLGVMVFYLAPILLFGPPAYPQTQYRAAALSVAISAIVGIATQGLVAHVRHEAGEARDREAMLERVTEVVHGLFESPSPRSDVCEAAKTISGGVAALLYEPVAGTAELRCTAATDLDVPAIGVRADPSSAAFEAFRSRSRKLVTEDVQAHVGSKKLWEASGRPASVLYQPLLRGDVQLGVLVVSWPDNVRAEGSRATVVALLAHEAAAVIARADAMDQLSDEAQTDPLTGLPNRRAWDAHFKRVVGAGQQLVFALLDFDHFKQFNDTQGHPAGDRLLKETAAAWRDELREGDFLSRLGGEEFGLVLTDCDLQTATDVVERLRRHVSMGRTCSAGLAVHENGESAESLVSRADRALYRAKALGRDRAHVDELGEDIAPSSAND
jgi:diguanylate cyclase (GGDEF)-like protein